MKHPVEGDFTVTRKDGGVHAAFKPSDSHYDFRFLANAKDIARFGPLSSDVTVRHGKTGDTGEYNPEAVMAMARLLAERAASP